jgi:hypothetical protein
LTHRRLLGADQVGAGNTVAVRAALDRSRHTVIHRCGSTVVVRGSQQTHRRVVGRARLDLQRHPGSGGCRAHLVVVKDAVLLGYDQRWKRCGS